MVIVGLTVMEPVTAPPGAQRYEYKTPDGLAVNVVEAPLQIVIFVAEMDALGGSLTSTNLEAVPVQPLAAVPVTV